MDRSITISGASDDLIEVEGAFTEEFSPSDTDEFYLAVSDGTVLKGRYDGVWRFVTHMRGSATMDKVEAPSDDDDNYSDRVTLTGSIAWVALATAIAK